MQASIAVGFAADAGEGDVTRFAGYRRVDGGAAEEPSYRLMLETLQTREYREELMLRLKDLESLLKCARLGLDSLRENTDVISEMQMFKLQESLQSNTRNLESLFDRTSRRRPRCRSCSWSSEVRSPSR